MPKHYSLLYHKMRFLSAQHQSFLDTDLKDLGQVSKTTIEFVSKYGEVVHENFQAIAKKVREDCHHASLKCRGGVAQSKWHASEGKCAKSTCERHLLLIIGMDRNQVVARISV